MQLEPADQRRALAGVSKDDAFSALNDDQTKQYVEAHRQKVGAGPIAPMPDVDMKTSRAPGIVRAAGHALPVATGAVGAVLGAPAFGGGAVVGGAVGAGVGEMARQQSMRAIFGNDETDPYSRQGLKETAGWAAMGGISEVPAALAQGAGDMFLASLARAKDPKEVGDVIKGFNDAHPFALTRQGLKEGLEQAKSSLSKQLKPIYQMSKGNTNLDALLQSTQAEAGQADATFAGQLNKSTYKGVTTATNRIIAAAKVNAGIKSGQAVTVEQLANFQRELSTAAKFEARQNPSVGGVVQKILQNTYRTVGSEVDRMAPPVRPILDRMINLHAAISSVESGGSRRLMSTAVTAATHPRTAAALSPLAIPAAIAGGEGARDLIHLIP